LISLLCKAQGLVTSVLKLNYFYASSIEFDFLVEIFCGPAEKPSFYSHDNGPYRGLFAVIDFFRYGLTFCREYR